MRHRHNIKLSLFLGVLERETKIAIFIFPCVKEQNLGKEPNRLKKESKEKINCLVELQCDGSLEKKTLSLIVIENIEKGVLRRSIF